MLLKSTCDEIKSSSFPQLFVSGSWSFTAVHQGGRSVKSHESEENTRRTSAKPGMPMGVRKALWERPCGFCHWSLSEADPATSHSQKASWVRKLAELLVLFRSLSETDGVWTLKAELSFPPLPLEDWSVYGDGWGSEKGFGWKAELLGYTGMGWAVGGGRPFPSLLPSHKQLLWSWGGDPLEERFSMWWFLCHRAAGAHFPWGSTCTWGQMPPAAHWQHSVAEGAKEGIVLP